MRIALVHYHLRRGGVTSVLANQARTIIDGGDEVLVLTGELGDGEFGFSQVLIEELEYDCGRPGLTGGADRSAVTGGEADGVIGDAAAGDSLTDNSAGDKDAAILAEKMLDAMKAHWGAAADVIHIHNPLIQKNAALLPALHILNKMGLCLLLQNHDMAEDFRPDVYITQGNYPENCHYAVINYRDYSFLRRAGLKTEGLHLLPNEVIPIKPIDNKDRKRYVYPVRAIRRKNIGEALLLSCYIPKERTIAITLPPATARDMDIYEHWKNLAFSLKLPVEFEIGLTENFQEIIGNAVAVITTSVKEGFGFSYLEPWTAYKAVIGRRIENVCHDFENEGIQFDALYDSLDIPMVYLSPPVLRKKMDMALNSTYASFGIDAPSYMRSLMEDNINTNDFFDFGRLDEELQTEIIKTVVANETARREISNNNMFLEKLSSWKEDPALIVQNREKILVAYGKTKTAFQLRDAYRKTMENKVIHRLSRSILLELFLNPLKLSLVGVSNE